MSVVASLAVSFSLLDIPVATDVEGGDRFMVGANIKTAKFSSFVNTNFIW